MSNLDSNFVICDKEKLKSLYKRAAAGDAESQYLLGMHFQDAEFEEAYDESVAADIPERDAAYWLAKAAEQGIVDAQFALGNCYFNGTGVNQNRMISRDYAEAVKWFRKAADQRVEHAMESLAVCLKAPGEPHDEREAERWERKKEMRSYADTKLEYAWVVVREDAKYAWNNLTGNGPRTHHQ